MKRLIFTIKSIVVIWAGIVTYFMLNSYSAGPGTSGWDCTGGENGLGNPAGCSNCHGTVATTGITVAVELDSVGIPTTHYKGGMHYTVKVSATNTTTSNLPKFGLQLG